MIRLKHFRNLDVIGSGSYRFRQFAKLPNTLQEVEWIGSRDTKSFIETGVVPDGDMEIIFRFSIGAVLSTNRYIFGTNASVDNPRYNIRVNANETTFSFYVNTASGSAKLVGTFSFNLNDVIEVRIVSSESSHNLAVSCGGATSTYDYAPNLSPIAPIKIFSYAGADSHINMNFYEFVCRKNGELIQYLVPCYNKDNGEIGACDLVSKAVLLNGGTGNFVKGGDV